MKGARFRQGYMREPAPWVAIMTHPNPEFPTAAFVRRRSLRLRDGSNPGGAPEVPGQGQASPGQAGQGQKALEEKGSRDSPCGR
jgi:hypothetical protein